MTIDLTGTEVLGFRITGLLGQGGMATVWRAEHPDLGTMVAVKVLNPLLASDATLEERFVQEARIQVRLRHPNIVRVENFSRDPLAMIMEYVEGKTLSHVIGREVGPIPFERARPLMLQILAAVEHAHGKGVIHRDLKPSNVLVDGDGAARVMDFGIAKLISGVHLTSTGATLGTPMYMSPEQIKGAKDVDARADIYSLGVTFYEMLAGQAPFEGDGDSDNDFLIKEAHVRRAPPDPREFYPAIPAGAVEVVLRALAKEPAARYASAGEMLQALEAVTEDAEVPAPKKVPGQQEPEPEKKPPPPRLEKPQQPSVVVEPPPAPRAPTARLDIVATPVPAASRGLVWVVLVGVVVMVIGLVVWSGSGSTEDPTPKIPENTPPPAIDEPSGPTVASEITPVPANTDDTGLRAKINSALDSEQWQDALDSCGKLSSNGKAKAKSSCDKAKLERDAKESFEKFNTAAIRNERLEALRAHARIPRVSVYKKKDRDRYRRIRSEYLKYAHTDLDEAVSKKDCARAKTMADQIKEVDPDDINAAAKARKCETVVAVRPPPRRPPIRMPRPPRVPPQKVVKPPAPDASPRVPPKTSGPTMAELRKAKELIKIASGRYIATDYKAAIRAARVALKYTPGNQMAIQIIGASACYIKKMSSIKWAYRRLPAKKRQMLRQICKRNGISFGKSGPSSDADNTIDPFSR